MFLLLFLLVIKRHHFFVLFIWLWIFLWSIYSWINNINISQKIFLIQQIDKEVILNAEVLELYKKSQNHNLYILKVNNINYLDHYNVNFLLYYPKNYLLERWQIINIKTKITKIDSFSDNFNYEKFLQTKNVYFQVFANNVDLIDKKELSKIEKFIINIRQKLLKIVYDLYPKDEAVFLAWILIWAREDMSENLQNSFNNSWLTHLVAVSWFNITIIIIFLWFLFSFFPLILRTFLICLFVVIFVLVVWDNVPVIRAGIMWLIGYFILVSWRKSDSLSLLLFTAFVLVIYNPLYLNYDVSFHLSFLAVLGLLYFQEFWWKIFKFLPSFFAVKESFVLTMSALTTTLPIMIFSFGQVSILAPISNMLVGWVIPFAMLFWFLSILWEIIWYKIGFIIWFINYFLLKYVILVAEYFWNLEFAVFKINFWIFWVYLEILYFMMLIFWIIYFRQEKNPTK